MRRRSVLVLSVLVAAATGCEKQAESSAPKSIQTSYHKVLGPETSHDTLAAQFFAVLQRLAYSPAAADLAPHLSRNVDGQTGVESISVLSAEEGIRCDRITGLAGIVFMCELALKREGLAPETDVRSIPAILYRAIADVRGTSPKVIMDGLNSIACKKDSLAGFSCDLSLPGAVQKSDATDKPTLPQAPHTQPTGPAIDIPVFQ